jgi:hypothetical protein
MPEKLVMHPDMTDEEWARWDCVLSELSKTTNLAPFCSGKSTEQQSESDVLPCEYDALKTNDYANPVAARKLPHQKPVIGNSGSAFCYAVLCSLLIDPHQTQSTQASFNDEAEQHWNAS